jgi:flagellin-like hook-associated protein FlgL
MEWNGDQLVTGSQTVTGGVNVGDATDAATAQVKMKSSSSPSVAWHSTYQPGSAGPSLCSAATGSWTPRGGLVSALAQSGDGLYASSPYGTTDPLGTSSFGFSIPANATIAGVEVSYRIWGGSPGGPACFRLHLSGSLIGSEKEITIPTSWESGTLGSSTDLWGASLTPAIINDSAFGVKTWMSYPPPPIYYKVDYISVKIYYTTGGQWMAGSLYWDGSWRLANSVTSLYSNTKLLMMPNTGYLRIGNGTAPSYPLHMAGGAYCTGTTWTNGSSRSQKLNIAPVPAASAWELLDLLQPVDFEYRKTETQFKLKDGSVVREQPADPNEVAEEVTVWTEEGSGECHRGFIAEDVPAPLTRGDGIAALDIAANNTAALKEAKRRIMELERQLAALTPAGSGIAGSGAAALGVAGSGAAAVGVAGSGAAAVGVAGSGAAAVGVAGSGAAAVGAVGSGASGVSDLSDASDLSDKTLQRLTESVLKKIGVEPWVEITAAEAWEEVDETAPVSAVETVTRYRFNPETRLAEAYTVQETVTRQEPTGRKIVQLKNDARLDETTGKFYRWCGLGGAANGTTVNGTANAAQAAAALGKILAPGTAANGTANAAQAAAALAKLSRQIACLGTQDSRLQSQDSPHSPQSSALSPQSWFFR